VVVNIAESRFPLKRVKFDGQVSKIDAPLRLNKSHLKGDVFAFAIKQDHE